MKAQLVLLGGRSSVPNLLTVLYQRPDEVFVLTSSESTGDFGKFKDLIKKYHPSCNIEEKGPVDAFDYGAIAELCHVVFQANLDAEWICNITAATTIMSIGVYEQAKLFKFPCWYLNTANSRVICLVGPKIGKDEERELFHLTVEQYINAYYHVLKNGDMEDRRDLAEQKWLPFAQVLGENLSLVSALKKAIDKGSPSKDQPKGYKTGVLDQTVQDLLKMAEKLEILNKLHFEQNVATFTLNHIQYHFLNGKWLEAYVWNEAKQAHIFDDCQWNYKIDENGVAREIDVALTYKAQLIVVECKTGDEKKSDVIRDLVSIVSPIGHRFVGKLLASSFLTQIEDDFKNKAHRDGVILVLADKIPNIGQCLKEEAENPTYPRI